MTEFFRVEDLKVYERLCDLHIEICDLTQAWPASEKYELGSQIRRASNSAPANLAERHSDRHVKNKIEGTNRARGESLDLYYPAYPQTASAGFVARVPASAIGAGGLGVRTIVVNGDGVRTEIDRRRLVRTAG